jgi:AcrR family transcriptional regulator
MADVVKPEPDREPEARLLEAAGEVFGEKGFEGASVREVCQRAGVKNVGAVNYYFRSKDNLYNAVLKHAFGCPLAHMPAPAFPEGLTPADKLRLFIRGVVEHFLSERPPWQMKLLFRELSQPGPGGEAVVREFIKPVFALLCSLLREAMPGPVDDVTLHLTAFSIMGQCFHHRVARPVIRLVVGEAEADRYDVDRLARHIADFSLAALGLYRPGAPSGGPTS